MGQLRWHSPQHEVSIQVLKFFLLTSFSRCRLASLLLLLAPTLLLIITLSPPPALACNEAVCASIVSKCMLLQSCKCDLQPDCTCCKQCFECLDYLYSECCSCVDMCPKPNVTIHELSRMSHREPLEGSIPTLFQALTAQSDAQARWSIVTFPIDIDTSSYQPSGTRKPTAGLVVDSSSTTAMPVVAEEEGLVTVNCTVAYMGQCMSWNKCKASCTSMGATSYRWFHDGCCECVGSQCINYGINQSRCEDCPLLDDIDEDITDEEMERLVNMDYDDFHDEDGNTIEG